MPKSHYPNQPIEELNRPLDQRDFPRHLTNDMRAFFGLIRLADIRLDCDTATLSANADMGADSLTPMSWTVQPEDVVLFQQMNSAERVQAELRMADKPFASYRLILQEPTADFCWASGAILELSAPTAVIDELASLSRLTELGRQHALLSHELRQPLFTIAMANENLRLILANQPHHPPHISSALQNIEQQVSHAQTILDQSLDFAAGRSRNGDVEAHEEADQTAELVHTIDQAIKLLTLQITAADIEIHLQTGEQSSLSVAMRPIELEQVLINVLRNAIDSIGQRRQGKWIGKGNIRIELRSTDTEVICTIADNGAGLSEEAEESNFQPFHTTKGRNGNGLGLFLCENLLKRSGGSIRLLPGETEGARVIISLSR